MTKKPRENRVPIMMSDEELTAIDDWRFENRIATRSDAIRRLAAGGIAFDQGIGDLLEKGTEVLEDMDATEQDIFSYFERLSSEQPMSRQQAMEIALLYAKLVEQGAFDKVHELVALSIAVAERTGMEIVKPRERRPLSFSSIHKSAATMLKRWIEKDSVEEDE